MSIAYVDPRDMLNYFCFYVYAQKSLFKVAMFFKRHQKGNPNDLVVMYVPLQPGYERVLGQVGIHPVGALRWVLGIAAVEVGRVEGHVDGRVT